MNRLWLRIAAGIALSLFLVFFLQFLAITLEAGSETGEDHAGLPPVSERAEVQRRLVGFAGLSALVGVVGGLLVAASVAFPLRRISQAAEKVERGDLAARAPERGAREIAELGRSFNAMALALERAEAGRVALFADLSHELRTPLAALEANLQAAFDGVYGLDEAALARLLEQTRHLGRLVNDLRELSLSEAGRLALDLGKVDLGLLRDEVVEALEPLAAERGVRLAASPGTGPAAALVVVADETRIRQVLFNLVANAIRHAREGGRVEISCGTEEQAFAFVEVEDDGVGLQTEELALVFDRFYRGDPSRSRDTGGSGLGLAISKALVEEHGGRIEARSAGRGRGAIFSIHLPVGGPAAQPGH